MPIYTPGKVTLAKGQPVPNDPNFAFNSLLLHGNGANGSTVITDSSGSPKTVTAFGNAQISTAQSKFGGASIAFDGTGDYLNIPASSEFNFDSNNFTIETWLYFSAIGATKVIVNNWAGSVLSSSFGFQQESDGRISGIAYTGSTVLQALTLSTATINQWNHIAFVRNGGSLCMYLNGVGGTNVSIASAVNNGTGPVQIGREGTSFYFNGYLDDLRITKGIARYTSNFTPPTLPFPDF